MLIRNAMVYRNKLKKFLPAEILIRDGVIRKIGTVESCEDEVVDARGAYLVPGLLDVHTHGRLGYDFVSASPHDYGILATDYARHGVTTVMPTLATDTLENMLAATDALNRFSPRANEASFCGVHWEGRYLNAGKRGAHAPELLSALEASDFSSPVFKNCRALHITAAYELDRDGSFAATARRLGATLGLGHTCATYAEAKEAEERGVTSYTHLFNAMPPLHHRDGGAVCAALEGDAIAELICDGIHIAPEMIRLAYRAKGPRGISLVSDSIVAAGYPDGRYESAGLSITVKDGIARTDEGVLAGSTLTLDRGVNNLIDFCGIPLTDAILCATESPARQMNVFDTCGSIDVGKRADLLFLTTDKRLDIGRVMLRGSFLA